MEKRKAFCTRKVCCASCSLNKWYIYIPYTRVVFVRIGFSFCSIISVEVLQNFWSVLGSHRAGDKKKKMKERHTGRSNMSSLSFPFDKLDGVDDSWMCNSNSFRLITRVNMENNSHFGIPFTITWPSSSTRSWSLFCYLSLLSFATSHSIFQMLINSCLKQITHLWAVKRRGWPGRLNIK